MLLSYYLDERSDSETINRIISELKSVKSGEKNFQEVFNDVYGTIVIGVTAGEFKCNKETAYFISENPEQEPSLEIPIQELIDILEEWKAFSDK